MTFALINAVAQDLRGDFPTLDEIQEVEVPPGMQGVRVSPNQIAGARYVGHPSGLVVTLQNRLLTARWRRTAGHTEYPRFAALESCLWKAFESVFNHAEEPIDEPIVLNMAYMNLIRPAGDKSVLDYFTESVRIGIIQTGRPLRSINVAWRETEEIDFRFELTAGVARDGGEQGEVFRLATAAGITLKDGVSPQDALRDIHERLQTLFLNVISEDAKQEWQLVQQ